MLSVLLTSTMTSPQRIRRDSSLLMAQKTSPTFSFSHEPSAPSIHSCVASNLRSLSLRLSETHVFCCTTPPLKRNELGLRSGGSDKVELLLKLFKCLEHAHTMIQQKLPWAVSPQHITQLAEVLRVQTSHSLAKTKRTESPVHAFGEPGRSLHFQSKTDSMDYTFSFHLGSSIKQRTVKVSCIWCYT